jgi:predicted ATPase/DNA-binding winged helix-turn-helix (wHTH) protein
MGLLAMVHDGRPVEELLGAAGVSYSFGEYRFIPSRQLLLRAGTPVRIGTRALDLLHILVQRQGELVSKEQLIAFAWPDTFVHESNLKVNIGALRRGITQAASELPHIATAPGRGYRFVTPVRIETVAAAPTVIAQNGPDNLPPLQQLFGRQDEIDDLSARLASTGFLTIAGPAGVGKTAVAVAVSRQVAHGYDDGVCFVDLSAIGDPRLVCPAIASSLGAGGNLADMLAGLVEALRDKRKLLILDNCEHVLSSTCMVADHLRAALPGVGILATSREPLRSQYETVHLLAPLPTPEPGPALDREAAMTSAAIALFVTRAGEATGYDLTDAETPVVAEICRRLDGIPLAIELAASRLASHPPEALLGLLDRSFELLNYGPRSAPARHQAFQATLDWSYRLLSDRDAMTLRLLSVFKGGFSLDDVIGVASFLEFSADEVARSVGNLATKSLIGVRFVDGRLQHYLLNATRSYAAERLRHAGEEQRTLTGHAHYQLHRLERAETQHALAP